MKRMLQFCFAGNNLDICPLCSPDRPRILELAAAAFRYYLIILMQKIGGLELSFGAYMDASAQQLS